MSLGDVKCIIYCVLEDINLHDWPNARGMYWCFVAMNVYLYYSALMKYAY